MLQEEFKKVYDEYNKIFAPMISKMIQDNYKYFQISEIIRWRFIYHNDLAIMGTCDRKNNEIHLNIFSVKKAYEDNNLMDVEYFIIHEARHVFQNIKIKEHKDGINTGVDPNLIEKWIYEGEHYIESLDENGNENPKYFEQDSELDAYAFSYALMKYKYKDVDLYVPKYYGNEFYSIVEDWLKHFKNYDEEQKKMTWSTQSIVKVFYIGKNDKKSHVEKVVYRLSRLCHISADVTVNVTQNVTVNIIITSGGNGRNPNAIIFLILEGGSAA